MSDEERDEFGKRRRTRTETLSFWDGYSVAMSRIDVAIREIVGKSWEDARGLTDGKTVSTYTNPDWMGDDR